MTIFRGIGGGGNATTDSEINVLTQLANQAEDFAEQAGLEADAAAVSAASASGSAASSASSAAAALASETEAALSESAAAISASNALTSENNAATSASTATTQAGIATTQAGLSAASAAASDASATASAASASTATTQAGIATTGASTATTQAGIATTGASTATTQAGIATTQAGLSAASAAAALVSQGAAATSASNALASANSASSSASTATAQATIATDAAAEAVSIVLGGPSNRPSIRPSLSLDFANTKALDPRITFTRASTATYFDYKGTMQTAASGAARFDHNPTTGESLGLLIEEQRTNLVTYSEQFDNGVWAGIGVSLVVDSVVAPDAALAGDSFIESAATSTHQITQTVSFSANATLCLSVYVKQQETGSARHIRLQMGATNGFRAYFDLTNGTVATQAIGFGTGTAVTSSGSITPVGDGWYRCSVAGTCGPSDTTSVFVMFMQNTPTGGASYTGDGYSGIYIWGAQLEAGSFPTSYIPTVASQVTRAADAASMTGTNFSSWYRQDEGTLYAEAAFIATQSTKHIFNFSDGTDNNFIAIRSNPSTPTGSRFSVFSGGSSKVELGFSNTAIGGVLSKYAASYRFNDCAFSANGLSTVVDTSAIIPVVSLASIGANTNNAANCHIRKLSYYPIRVTNTQLQALTS